MRTALLVGALILGTSCGWSVEGAREAAAAHSCEFSDRCGDIGSGQTYASYDECLTKQRSTWLDRWPTSNCSGRINAQQIDLCLKEIDAASCGNLLDALSVLDKCSSQKVCAP